MKKILLSLAMILLSVSWASQTQAGPKTGGFKPSNVHSGSSNIQKLKVVTPINKFAKIESVKVNDYHLTHGVKFAQGTHYKRKNHQHWTLVRWDLRYGCYCYWDPYVSVWYYWCEQDVCYYPVSYCPYRTYCNCGVPEVAVPVCETCRPLTCETCATIRPDAVPSASEAPPTASIPVIPEPVEPR
jgi:hypothetical protein